MATQHTPGPWNFEEGHVQRDSGGIRYWQISDGQDAIACNQFCYAGYDTKTNEANARLIAAAPDLFAAVTQYRDDLRRPPAPDSVERRLAMIDAVLAKAGVA